MQNAADAPFSEPERRCPYCGVQLYTLRCGDCFREEPLELAAEFSRVEVLTMAQAEGGGDVD